MSSSEKENRPLEGRVTVTGHPLMHEVVTKRKQDPLEEPAPENWLLIIDFSNYLPWCDVLATVHNSCNNYGAIMMYAWPTYRVKFSTGLQAPTAHEIPFCLPS